MKPLPTKPDELSLQPADIDLGGYLRNLRGRRGWTLADAATAAGIAPSSLSKVENSQMSPTYDLLLKLANGYGVDIAEFFTRSDARSAAGRMAVTRGGEGQHHVAQNYDHEVLAAALTRKRMMPFRTVIRRAPADEPIEWSAHAGEEFVYVMSGRVIFHTEHYAPVALGPGDSVYIDSGMKHAAVAEGDADAEVLWVAAA